jgi:hypothetical protein
MKNSLFVLATVLPFCLSAQIKEPAYPAKNGRLHLDTTITLRNADKGKLVAMAGTWFSNNHQEAKAHIQRNDLDGMKAQGHYSFPTFIGNGPFSILVRCSIEIGYLPDGRVRVQFFDYRLLRNIGYRKDNRWFSDRKAFRRNGKMKYVAGEFRTKTIESMYRQLAELERMLNAG